VRPPCQRNYQKPQEDPRTIGGGLKELGSRAAGEAADDHHIAPGYGYPDGQHEDPRQACKEGGVSYGPEAPHYWYSAAIYPDEPIPHGARRSAGGSEEPSFSTRSL
jgi:hypothetical protein